MLRFDKRSNGTTVHIGLVAAGGYILNALIVAPWQNIESSIHFSRRATSRGNHPSLQSERRAEGLATLPQCHHNLLTHTHTHVVRLCGWQCQLP